MPTDKEYLILSQLSYFNFNEDDIGDSVYTISHDRLEKWDKGEWLKDNWEDYQSELENWKVIDFESSWNGYYGVAFQNKTTGEVVIANRGTQDWADGVQDLALINPSTDEALLSQFASAQSFYNQVLIKAGNNRITVTGHSLGGAITQVLAANNDLSAVTFNAPGVLHLLNPLQILKLPVGVEILMHGSSLSLKNFMGNPLWE
ncbi:lipase family protein [Geobacillus thermocatenulatus]|uniref:lipase family protein n=1 Tax=Geobacillus thermocatenulatus TaxID=33938 RepID=UPI000473D26D|nr:hypothetical protein [Geobacillus thermocatenulatus]